MKRLEEHQPSRLEAFSDGVFALSAALLVVSLEMPRDYEALMANLRGFLGFGLSFTVLVWIWSAHRGFFRRYPLDDGWIVALNGLLLFLVLFYVYPLKFLATALVERFLGISPYLEAGGPGMIRSAEQGHTVLLVYSLGFVAVFACFALLYWTAVRRSTELDLGVLERFDARTYVRHYGLCTAVGVLSVVLTLTDIGGSIGLPGWIYAFLGPLCGWNGAVRGRQRVALERSLQDASESANFVGS